jgi:hypothetical protein
LTIRGGRDSSVIDRRSEKSAVGRAIHRTPTEDYRPTTPNSIFEAAVKETFHNLSASTRFTLRASTPTNLEPPPDKQFPENARRATPRRTCPPRTGDKPKSPVSPVFLRRAPCNSREIIEECLFVKRGPFAKTGRFLLFSPEECPFREIVRAHRFVSFCNTFFQIPLLTERHEGVPHFQTCKPVAPPNLRAHPDPGCHNARIHFTRRASPCEE